MKTIVVLGCNGYVGSLCITYLSKNSNSYDHIVGIDRINTVPLGTPPLISNKTNIDILYIDSLDDIKWNEFGDNVHIIYTISASSHLLDKRELQKGSLIDLQILNSLFSNLNHEKASYTLSYLSSGAVYGNSKGILSEESLIEANNPYSLMKIMSEEFIKYASEEFSIRTHIFRLFQSYYLYQNPLNFMGKLINSCKEGGTLKLYKRGSQIRSFLFGMELVEALMIEPKSSGSEIFNVGSDEHYSLRDFAKLLNIKNLEIIGEDDPKDIIVPDISKIQKILGWSPSLKLPDGAKFVLDNLSD